jgi:N-terminal domain in fatty acid synthase subunit beta
VSGVLTWLFQVSIPVSAKADESFNAESFCDEFAFSLDDADFVQDLDSHLKATVELLARFLDFISQRLQEDPQSIDARTAVLLVSPYRAHATRPVSRGLSRITPYSRGASSSHFQYDWSFPRRSLRCRYTRFFVRVVDGQFIQVVK